MDIQQKLEPVIETFIKSLDSIKDDMSVKQDEINKELTTMKEHNASLEDQKKSNNLNYKATEDKLNNEIVRYKGLQAELQAEIDKIKLGNKNIDKSKREAEQALIAAKAERKLTQDTRVNLDSDIKKYRDKTEFLKSDFDLLQKRRDGIIFRENTVKEKERVMLKREEQLVDEESKLSIRDVEIRSKEKQVALEIKRSALNV